MLRVTIEVCPPEGERRTIETIEIANLSEVRIRGECPYVVNRRANGGDMRGHVYHDPDEGALRLVAKACEAVRR